MKIIKELYNYRELLKTNIKKEIRGKYKGSAIGVLWSFINPLLTVVVYAIVFPYLMRMQQDNYLQFLICGIIPWTFFTSVVQQGNLTIKANAGIVKKVYFPRIILPISVAVSALINFMISCLIIIIFLLLGGIGISWHILFVPIIATIQLVFSLGIALILSSVNVYLQDVEYIVNFMIQLLFYGTPVLYSIEMFSTAPPILLFLVKLNPMTHFVEAYRNVFMYHSLPNLENMTIIIIASVLLLYIGYIIFDKLEKGFAEEI